MKFYYYLNFLAIVVSANICDEEKCKTSCFSQNDKFHKIWVNHEKQFQFVNVLSRCESEFNFCRCYINYNNCTEFLNLRINEVKKVCKKYHYLHYRSIPHPK